MKMKIEFDEGYAFGLGVFETIKVKEGKAFFLEKHLRRLQKALDFFHFSYRINEEEIQNYLLGVEEKNFAFKIIVSDQNVLFLKREDPYQNYNREKGLQLRISSIRRNSTSPMTYHKTLQYADNILAKREAKEKGYDEALFLNERGNACEGAVSNLFFVKGEQIYTPKLEEGLLAGTMREYIMEQYPVQEISIPQESIKDFDACFISNALMGVLWVECIDEILFSKTPHLEKILEDFSKLF